MECHLSSRAALSECRQAAWGAEKLPVLSLAAATINLHMHAMMAGPRLLHAAA